MQSFQSSSGAQSDRHHWVDNQNFLVTCLSCIIGLGDMSMFPLLVYKNGGGAFFIPYFITLICVGLPILFLEMLLGQFTSTGPLLCWNFCPLLSGIGINMIVLVSLTAIYYNVLISWALYFLFSSLLPEAPWMTCGNWSSRYCISNVRLVSKSECHGFGIIQPNGECQHNLNSTQLWIWNERIARRNNIILTYPTYEYFEAVALGHHHNDVFSIDTVSLQIVFCMMLTTFILWMFIMNGTMFSAKLSIIILTIPFLILFAFLIRGLILDGSLDGVQFFLLPNLNRDVAPKRWVAAGHQVCFSLAITVGCLTALSSYNKFHYDILRDTLILPAVDCIVGMLSGIVVFSHLGYVASVMNVGIDGLAKGGLLGTFDIFPFVLSQLPSPTIWIVFFFFMMIVISLNSERILLETILITLLDLKPSLKERKYLIISAACMALFIFGLPMATQEGMIIMKIVIMSTRGVNIFILTFLESVAVGWLYGADRFLRDIETMTRSRYFGCLIFGQACRMWWKISWMFICPISSLCLIIFSGFNATDNPPAWPRYISTFFSLVCLIGVAVYHLMAAQGTMKERWKTAVSPTREWGPAQVEKRMLVKLYSPDLIVYLHDGSLAESVPKTVSLIIQQTVEEKAWNDVQTDLEERSKKIILDL